MTSHLDAERQRAPRIDHPSVWAVITNKYVLIMALVYSGAAGASTALALWMPQLVKSFSLTNWQTGLLNSVPFGIAAVWMILWGRNSDRTGERVWHNALPLGWMVLAMVGTFFAIGSLWAMIPLLTLVAAGTYASKGPFWALSSEWLGAAAANPNSIAVLAKCGHALSSLAVWTSHSHCTNELCGSVHVIPPLLLC